MKLPAFLKNIFPLVTALLLLFMPLSSNESYAKTNISQHNKVETVTTYITSFKQNKGKWVGKFDYIQWYFGKEADKEFLKDCKCEKEMQHAPDGYWIRNINPKIRTFTISNSAQYVLQTRSLTAIKWNEKVTRSQFQAFLKERNQDGFIPFHIEIKNGIVTKIIEQYIP